MPARVATRAAAAAAVALAVMGGVAASQAGATSLPRSVTARPPVGATAAIHSVRAAQATASSAPAPPTGLPARADVLILEGSSKVLFADGANAELPIASTTKLMTAWVTLHREARGATLVEQPYDAEAGESTAPVPAGTRLSLPDMLRAMLLPSGNNVAYSLSLDVGGSEEDFVEEMNTAASALGLGRTHYSTPVGLDTPGNYSTAVDLAHLARALMRIPLFRKIVGEPSARLADGIVVDNRNDLVGSYPWVVGVKTGNTADAGECLVAAASLGGVRLISVVLGAPSEADRDSDTLALLRYGLRLYRSAAIAERGRVYATVPVAGRTHPARLVAARSLRLVLARAVRLHVALEAPTRLTGPIPAGTREGSLLVTEDGRTVTSVGLFTAAAVPRPRADPHALHVPAVAWYGGGAGVALLLVVGCSLPLMRRRAARNAAPGLQP
jgi:D-alanyl-D-alanine carboxypeptidase (penicillin-binding protein 5/6)